MWQKLKGWIIDIASAVVAYVAARWIWSDDEKLFEDLGLELLTFGAVFLLFQILIRGLKYLRKGKTKA